MYRKSVFFLLVAGTGILLLYYLFLCYSYPYANTIAWIKEHFDTAYNIASIDQDYFTQFQYTLFWQWATLITLLYWIVVLCLWHKYTQVVLYLSVVKSESILLCENLRKQYHVLTTYQKIAILALYSGALVHHIYYCIEIPFNVDEVFAYNYFVHQSPLVPLFYYPEPNNHILFNLFASVFDLFIHDGCWTMRLPSLLANLCLLTIIFIYLLVRVNFRVALVATICCIISFPTSIYATQGRGYMLMSMWAILAILSFIEWKRSSRKIYLLSYIASSIAGFYTHSTFLYCFTGLFLWEMFYIIKTQNLEFIKTALWTNVLILSIVLLLYSPILAFSGWKALIDNRWIASNQTYFLKMFFVQLLEGLSLLTDVWHKVYILIFFLGLFIGFVFRKFIHLVFIRQLVAFTFFQVVGIILILLILRRLPPLRVWTYLTFWYPITLSVVLYLLSVWIKKQYVFIVLSLCLIISVSLQSIHSYQQNLTSQNGPFSQKFYTSLQRTVDYIFQKNPQKIFVNEHWFQFYLHNQQIKRHLETPYIDMYLPRKEIVYDFVIFSPDMVSHKLPDTFSLQSYRLITEFEGSKIYERIPQQKE
ncbi:hypothetical protein [Xanthocytophaga flava]|uniref:hypothetical protein n=1 Tax=Xanthocytophaga flava TaxID=3048013 RepID=UPI0028D13A4F|nr:hypothetical protein [Xanthocytophaga flavus]MDJ1468036.1 hypothetical protein [Xanthocytophaga flavus]